MATEPEIESFFEQWIAEFSRAVKMFTGEEPVLTYIRRPEGMARQEIEESRLAERLWWKQPVEGEETFAIWVGSPPECWMGIGNAVDESDPRRMYLEMLSQANQGTIAALSAEFPRPLRAADGVEDDLTSLGALEVAEVKMSFRGNEFPVLLLAVEPSAARMLRLSGTDEEKPAAPNVAGRRQLPGGSEMAASQSSTHLPRQPAIQSPMLARLLEVRLPVSVLLGHTSISIREVLKLTPGSLIELDRKIGDYVEIVIHGTVVARGEIVSVDGNYGVRIKEVMSREDRLALRDAA
jgi:flagellar motor switch protein FliN/FliY